MREEQEVLLMCWFIVRKVWYFIHFSIFHVFVLSHFFVSGRDISILKHNSEGYAGINISHEQQQPNSVTAEIIINHKTNAYVYLAATCVVPCSNRHVGRKTTVIRGVRFLV